MVLWMSLIFFYSSRPADVSARDSGRIGIWLGSTFVPGFQEWPQEKQEDFAEKVDHPVRKTAHATEYAILGILAAGVCMQSARGSSSRMQGVKEEKAEKHLVRELLLPWVIASAYAATDEFHQLFVPGRSGQISDVMLDSAGALAGVAVFVLIRRVIGRGQTPPWESPKTRRGSDPSCHAKWQVDGEQNRIRMKNGMNRRGDVRSPAYIFLWEE